MSRIFLWGSNTSKRKLHPIKWHSVCANFNQWGIQIPKSNIRNKSLLMSLAWWFNVTCKNALWATIIHSKYNSNNQLNNSNSKHTNSSLTWKSICLGWSLCQKGLAILIGSDGGTFFVQVVLQSGYMLTSVGVVVILLLVGFSLLSLEYLYMSYGLTILLGSIDLLIFLKVPVAWL